MLTNIHLYDELPVHLVGAGGIPGKGSAKRFYKTLLGAIIMLAAAFVPLSAGAQSVELEPVTRWCEYSGLRPPLWRTDADRLPLLLMSDTCAYDCCQPAVCDECGYSERLCCRVRSDMDALLPLLLEDQIHYYSWPNIEALFWGFGAGAILANTEMDQNFRDWYQDDVRSSGTDRLSDFFNPFGEGQYVIPALLASWAASEILYEFPSASVVEEWSQRSLRTALVGTAPMVFAQYATGGSRPDDPAGSEWRPFDDGNGVSGHAFIGAIPFINAAMVSESFTAKVGFYTLSAMPALSRINDDAHYASQAILGWWMAYCAASVVDCVGQPQRNWMVAPMPTQDGAGVAFSYYW